MEKTQRGEHALKPTVQIRRPRISRTMIVASAAVLVVVALALIFMLLPAGSDATLSIITAPSESLVSIDASPGISGVRDHEVKPGSHTISISCALYDTWDTTVTVAAGEELSLRKSLARSSIASSQGNDRRDTVQEVPPAPPGRTGEGRERVRISEGTLIVRAVPEGSVRIDGRLVANDAREATSILVSAGARTVEFTHPAYGKWQQSVSVKPGTSRSLTCYFEYTVNVVAQGSWGIIVVDGKETDMVTDHVFQLGRGKHTVTVRHKGYETLEGSKQIVVEPTTDEKQVHLGFTLRKRG